jgi:hypothetical protein
LCMILVEACAWEAESYPCSKVLNIADMLMLAIAQGRFSGTRSK